MVRLGFDLVWEADDMRALVRAAPVMNLAGVGAAAIFAVSLAGAKLAYCMLHSCDFATAWARTVPKNAYQGKVVWITGASSGIGEVNHTSCIKPKPCIRHSKQHLHSQQLLHPVDPTHFCFMTGKELAKQFASKGAKLILSSRRREVLTAVRGEIVAASRGTVNEEDIKIVTLDLEHVDSMRDVARAAIACFGKVSLFCLSFTFSRIDLHPILRPLTL